MPAGLLLVFTESRVPAHLLGVDPIALVAGHLGDRDVVLVGPDLDAALTRGGQVVVPVRMTGRTGLRSEDEDGRRVALIGQIHDRGDALAAGAASLVMQQSHRRTFEVAADPTLIGPEFLDDLRVPVVRLSQGPGSLVRE